MKKASLDSLGLSGDIRMAVTVALCRQQTEPAESTKEAFLNFKRFFFFF